MAEMADSASLSSFISTKPNPRERPVSRSVMMLTRPTLPYGSNNVRSSSSVVLKDRLPTKILFKRMFPSRLSCLTGGLCGRRKRWRLLRLSQNHRRNLPPVRLAFKRDHRLQKCQRKSKPPNGGRPNSSIGDPMDWTRRWGEAQKWGGCVAIAPPHRKSQAWPPGCEQPGKLGNITWPVQPNSRIPISEE